MRIALSANTQSGGGVDPEPLAEAMREHGAEVEVFGCEPDELERLAATRPDRVAVAGGDGTIGPAAETAGRIGAQLAVIATCTANDFARSNELPGDPLEAAALAATGIAHLLVVSTPDPLSYLGWIIGLSTAAAVVVPLIGGLPMAAAIAIAVVNLVVGLAIGSLVVGAAAAAYRPTAR